MEKPSNQYSENMQNFLKYIFERFSDKFTKYDLERIRNKIGGKGIEKITQEVSTYIEKNKEFDFEKLYNKLLPNKRGSYRHIPKMKSLLGHIVNFHRKLQEKEITAGLEQNQKQNSKEIINIFDNNDIIVDELLNNFCIIKKIKSFKYYFAKQYRETNGENNYERLINCINVICKNTTPNVNPEDKISINASGQIKIIKAKDEIIDKYNEFAIDEDEEKYIDIFKEQTTENTIEDILIYFFKDHKLDSFAIRTKESKDDIEKDLNNLFI